MRTNPTNYTKLCSALQLLMDPKHPYTQLLRDSIPQADPHKRWSDTVTLAELEHVEYLRKGCKFAGRCPLVMDICKTQVQPNYDVDGTLVKWGPNPRPLP